MRRFPSLSIVGFISVSTVVRTTVNSRQVGHSLNLPAPLVYARMWMPEPVSY